jgi:hypothetical protein
LSRPSWHTNWMRAIDPAVSGLRAERTSLLSLGDDECRFAVAETDDPLTGYIDKSRAAIRRPAWIRLTSILPRAPRSEAGGKEPGARRG